MSNNTEFPSLLERIKNVFVPHPAGYSEQINQLRLANDKVALACDAIIEAWSCALEMRKHGTEAHLRRVTELTVELAGKMGMTGDEIVSVRRGALLHDIGEMDVPDAILLKDGPLLPTERVTLRRHALNAYEMLSSIDYLRPALDIPYCHHERWDGTGYPRGLKAEEIPLAARIFSVVDTWDALRADRPYRKAWSDEKTWQYLKDQVNTEFDPAVVKTFGELNSLIQQSEIASTQNPTA
jgi:HD-GYP domain-containing protein (c-di-GMP phosphodiesterase class II)